MYRLLFEWYKVTKCDLGGTVYSPCFCLGVCLGDGIRGGGVGGGWGAGAWWCSVSWFVVMDISANPKRGVVNMK